VLAELPASATLSDLNDALELGRLALLNHLKDSGVARLPDRQTLANALSRRRKAMATA